MNTLIRSLAFLLCGVSFFCLTPLAHAQEEDQIDIDDIIPDLSPQEESELSNAFGVFTSATTVFTGLSGVSGGTFSFEQGEGREDGEPNLYRLPVSYTFNKETSRYRPRVRGVLGHFKRTTSVYGFSEALAAAAPELPPEINALPNQPDFAKDEATSLSGGIGLEMEPINGLLITPGFDLIWTHIKRRFDYNNFLSALFGVKFDRDIFNTSIEAISYVPNLSASYKIAWGEGYWITPSMEYSHLFTEDLWGKTNLANFSTDSGVLRTTIEAQIPTSWTLSGLPVGFHPYVIRTDISEAAHESLGFSYFHDIGLDITFDTNAEDWFFRQLRFGGAYVFGDDFDGYRLGITGDL